MKQILKGEKLSSKNLEKAFKYLILENLIFLKTFSSKSKLCTIQPYSYVVLGLIFPQKWLFNRRKQPTSQRLGKQVATVLWALTMYFLITMQRSSIMYLSAFWP